MHHTSNSNRLAELRLSLEKQEPSSFIGSGFFKFIHQKNLNANRRTWDFEDFTDPSTSLFLMPFNGVILSNIIDISDISCVPYILSRDGLIGLVDFFNRFPKPEPSSPTLIVPELFASVIPINWQPQILFYRYSLTNNQWGEASTLYVRANFAQSIITKNDLKELDECLHQLNPSRIILNATFPEDYFSQIKLTPPFHHLGELYRKTEAEISFLGWKDFVVAKDRGYYLNLNSSSLAIFDDYIDHMMLSKGHRPCSISTQDTSLNDLVYSLSPHHSIVISDRSSYPVGNRAEEIERMKSFIPHNKGLFQSDFIHYLSNCDFGTNSSTKWHYSHSI